MIYKSVTSVIQYFCFPNRPMKGEKILDFQKEGILRKGGVGGVDLEKGGMTHLANYALTLMIKTPQQRHKRGFCFFIVDS